MASVINEQIYSTRSGILMFPNGWQAWAHTFTLAEDEKYSEERNGRKIIPAGTIWPSNDVYAKGVLLYDVDITDGKGNGALLFEAAINENKVPVKPTKDCRTVLPRITWFPTVSTPGLGNILDPIEIPYATATDTGGFKVGAHLNMANDGVLSVPETSRSTYGVVKLGTTLSVDAKTGNTNVVAATAEQRGGIRVGDGVTVTDDLLSVDPDDGIAVTAHGVSVDVGNGLKIADDNTVAIRLPESSGLFVGADGLMLSDGTKGRLTALEKADVALGKRIDTEVTDRTAADTALGKRVDAEAEARKEADATLKQAIDSVNTDLDGTKKTLEIKLGAAATDGVTIKGDGTKTKPLQLPVDITEKTVAELKVAHPSNKMGVEVATASTLGVVKGGDNSITIAADGSLKVSDTIVANSTAGATALQTVAHDYTLTGDGTAAKPLKLTLKAGDGLKLYNNTEDPDVGFGIKISDDIMANIELAEGAIQKTALKDINAVDTKTATIESVATALNALLAALKK